VAQATQSGLSCCHKEELVSNVLDLVSKFEYEQVNPLSATTAVHRNVNDKSSTKAVRDLTQSVLQLISRFFDGGNNNCTEVVHSDVEDSAVVDYKGDVDDTSEVTGNTYVNGAVDDDDIILLDET